MTSRLRSGGRKAKWKRWRLELWDRQRGLCVICKELMPRKNDANSASGGDKKRCTIDHIVPLKDGGLDTFTNTQALCAKCNEYKDATPAGTTS